MIAAEKREALLASISTPFALGGLLGEPYTEDGCLAFVTRLLATLDINLTGNLREDGRHWHEIKTLTQNKPQFGDVAVFQGLAFAKYHVALMLDRSNAVQTSPATNGAGRIDIMRQEWAWALHAIYRHESQLGEFKFNPMSLS